MEPEYEEKAKRRGWFSRLNLSWPMLFLAGWILYELTTQSTLGAAAVCFTYGWEDFRAAIWLRRVDPWRLRGRAGFWLYLAWGLTKTGSAAIVMSLALVVISLKVPALQGPGGAAIMAMAAWTGLATLAGLGCAILTLAYAVALARWGGFKLWLSRDIHRARRYNYWPPYETSVAEDNRLETLLVGPLLIFFVALVPGGILFFLLLIPIIARFSYFIGIALGFYLLVAAPVLTLRYLDQMHRWLIASHPGECWHTSFEQPAQAESMAKMLDNPVK